MTHPYYHHIYRARQYPAADGLSLQLAEDMRSPEEILATNEANNGQLAKIERTQTVLAVGSLGLLAAGPLWGIAMMFAYKQGLISSRDVEEVHIVIAGLLGAGLMALALTAPWSASLNRRARRLSQQIRALRTITGTDACTDAAHYVVYGGEAVQEWRNCAIEERGQLYNFDVEVMRCLYVMDQVAQCPEPDPAARRAKLDADCRIAHGLVPSNAIPA